MSKLPVTLWPSKENADWANDESVPLAEWGAYISARLAALPEDQRATASIERAPDDWPGLRIRVVTTHTETAEEVDQRRDGILLAYLRQLAASGDEGAQRTLAAWAAAG